MIDVDVDVCLLEGQLKFGLCFLLFKLSELNIMLDNGEYYRGVAVSDTARKRRHPEPTPARQSRDNNKPWFDDVRHDQPTMIPEPR
jgi:hypothetical protein